MNCNIRRDVRVCYTKLRLSSHKFLVECARWLKVKVPYTQRTCTLCNSNDIEDEYHVTLVCEYFRDIRKKYIEPFYYQRPTMMKFTIKLTIRLKAIPAECLINYYYYIHALLVKRVYSECSPLLQLSKLFNTLKHDENDTILRKITEKSHSYNGFAFNVTRCFI